MLFNYDMDRRLADLYAALKDGQAITTQREGAFGHLPDRLIVSFGPRKFALDLPTSLQLADYLDANGHEAAGAQFRQAAA